VATGIGEQLGAARSARGIELEEVEERTKIRKRYLRAMEEERWNLLPRVAYARAFLRADRRGFRRRPSVLGHVAYADELPAADLGAPCSSRTGT
jgi:transcriptional regulator with XRE-family HTH domain